MEFSPLRQQNMQYSKLFADLADVLESDQSLGALALNYKSRKVQEFLQDYEYRVSPWPLIINDDYIRNYSDIIGTIPAIMNKVIRHYLSEDKEALCQYLNVSSVIASLYQQANFRLEDILCRYDAFVSGEEIKLLELNIGASLGGWQADWLFPELLAVLKNVKDIAQWNIKHRSITANLLSAMAHSAMRLKGPNTQGNIFLFTPPEATDNLENLTRNLNEVYQKARPAQFSSGEVIVFTELNDVKFHEDGEISYRGKVGDALLMSSVIGDEISAAFYSLAQSHSLKGRFFYPDSSNFTLLANKHLFGLLHKAMAEGHLSESESQLVTRHIPWTQKANQTNLRYWGESHDTKQYVLANRETLVLKKAHSMQGRDVYVGKSCTAEEWQSAFDKVCKDPDWLIQQFCEPDLVCTADPINGVGAYRIVWGFFSLNGKYGGNIGRGMQTKNNARVINSAQGAVEFVVVEEQPRSKKIAL